MKTRMMCYKAMAWVACGGVALQFSGCNMSVRTAAENGIISASNSFLASFLQALLQVASEAGTAGA